MFSLRNRPDNAVEHRKTQTVFLSFQTEPFSVETQEGVLEVGPETVDDWREGYYVAYPSDGSKPYPISPKFVEENYVGVGESS